MPKVLLLPVTGTPADAPVLQAALAVGRLFDGHLVALHVRHDVQRDIAAMASADMGLATGLQDMIDRMERDADKRAEAAYAGWHTLCSSNGIVDAARPGPAGMTAEWRTEIGDQADWLAEHGRTCDLIVVGRTNDGDIGSEAVIEQALMQTGKPVLLVGATADSLAGTIAIAWKDSREAAGAVAAALPFIRLGSRVIVFTVSEDDDDTDTSVDRLVGALRWHNPNTEARTIRPNGKSAVDALLGGAVEAGCGLLVMGGYGHTRLREAVFGGFTRSVLEHAPLPVLIAH